MCICSKEFRLAPKEVWPLPSAPGRRSLFAWVSQIVTVWFRVGLAIPERPTRWFRVGRSVYQLTWRLDQPWGNQSINQSIRCACVTAPRWTSLTLRLGWASLAGDTLCMLSHVNIRRINCPWPRAKGAVEAPRLAFLMDPALCTSSLGWFQSVSFPCTKPYLWV